MKAIEGYAQATATNFDAAERLPAGGYVLKVIGVRPEHYEWGDVLVIAFDVIEGEYKGFFTNQFKNMSEEFKKWKGTFRLNIPKLKSNSDDDKKKYEKSLRFFKSQIEAFNKSNSINVDCSKEWDENVLKNRLVGGVFGNKEWEMDGKTGWYTNCDHLTDVAKIRDGSFTVPKDRPLEKKTAALPEPAYATDTAYKELSNDLSDLSGFEELSSDGDVPF